jgi:2-polyprenyl-3-methyl-5-hydroxy-6-metoxy-1,4-benzoquinol methylase
MNIEERVNNIASSSPYGWGHPINFGDFTMPGILGNLYLRIVQNLDSYGWLPVDLSNLRTADVGCFSGGITKIMAERKASIVYAIDEIPEHLEQCKLVKEYFNLTNVEPIQSSLYRLTDHIENETLDLIICSGVLYHCSDMMTALLTLRDLLKPDGVLLIETAAVNDNQKSYANFGRFTSGMWWHPTSLCISDMCEFMGFETPAINFYDPARCLARMTKSEKPITFKRGINYPFADIHDEVQRTTDTSILRPESPLITA